MKKWVVGWLIVLMFSFLGKANAVTDPVGDPVVVFQDNCKVDSDCGTDAYCYQPPMPTCSGGGGMGCPAVMPVKYCKSRKCTPRPKCLDGEIQSDGSKVYCKPDPRLDYCPAVIIGACQSDSDCGKGAYCDRTANTTVCNNNGGCVSHGSSGVCKQCTPRPKCLDGEVQSDGSVLKCAPELGTVYCPVVNTSTCNVDSDCGTDAYCYQPPMPACPSGMACTDVMPNKICKQCTPRPEVLPLVGNESETEYIKRSGIVYCPVVKNCNVDSDCGKGAYCYQPPMPVCPIGTFCPQVLPRKVCTSISINNGDANGDGIVDLVDFSVWKTEYLNKTVSRADFNRDKIVDMTDFAVWKSYFIRITNNNI